MVPAVNRTKLECISERLEIFLRTLVFVAQDTRLPRHIFHPPILLKMSFKRMKAVFSKKIVKFSNFPKLKKIPDFFAKKVSIKVEKKFLKNKNHFIRILQHLTISVAFYGNFATIWR